MDWRTCSPGEVRVEVAQSLDGQWYHCLPKLCIIIMQMHNPSHICIIAISLFLALGAQSEIANPRRSGAVHQNGPPPARLCKV
jgi:hypothetical protein